MDCSCPLILHPFQLSKPSMQTTLISPTSVFWVLPLPILEMFSYYDSGNSYPCRRWKRVPGDKDIKDQEFKLCFPFVSLPVWFAFALIDKYNCRAWSLTLSSLTAPPPFSITLFIDAIHQNITLNPRVLIQLFKVGGQNISCQSLMIYPFFMSAEELAESILPSW